MFWLCSPLAWIGGGDWWKQRVACLSGECLVFPNPDGGVADDGGDYDGDDDTGDDDVEESKSAVLILAFIGFGFLKDGDLQKLSHINDRLPAQDVILFAQLKQAAGEKM